MVDRVKPGDPHWDTYVELQQRINTVECIPTWEEIREMEAVRQSGRVNMLSGRLVNILNDEGYYRALGWLLRCRERETNWWTFYEQTIEYFERDHGPRADWFTPEDRNDHADRALALEEERLRSQLQRVRRARQRVGVQNDPQEA